MKLSAPQLRVLKAMAEGWRLWQNTGRSGGGPRLGNALVRGDDAIRFVPLATVYSLQVRGLIVPSWTLPATVWTLTDAGRAALAEQEKEGK